MHLLGLVCIHCAIRLNHVSPHQRSISRTSNGTCVGLLVACLCCVVGSEKAAKPEVESVVAVIGDLRALLTDMFGKSAMLSKMAGDMNDASSPFSLLQEALDQCCKLVVSCFHAFYPSILLQWTALSGLLNQYNTEVRPKCQFSFFACE